MISAPEALERLREGNRRFVEGTRTGVLPPPERRVEVAKSQTPFAIILGCADSRVPPELVFDQGLGDLFVIRVAGNIVTPTQLGSIEYAAQHAGARLVVVLGHTRCGAVLATVEEVKNPTPNLSPGLRLTVDAIRPAVQAAQELVGDQDPDLLVQEAVRANIRASVAHVRENAPALANLVKNDGLRILGAEYSLDTGVVEFVGNASADAGG